MLGMDKGQPLGIAFGSILLVLVSVENPACVTLWVLIVIAVIVGSPGMFVLVAGEWQMTCAVAIGYNAIIAAVVGVEQVVAFLLVLPLQLMMLLIALVFSFPGWKFLCLCLDD